MFSNPVIICVMLFALEYIETADHFGLLVFGNGQIMLINEEATEFDGRKINETVAGAFISGPEEQFHLDRILLNTNEEETDTESEVEDAVNNPNLLHPRDRSRSDHGDTEDASNFIARVSGTLRIEESDEDEDKVEDEDDEVEDDELLVSEDL